MNIGLVLSGGMAKGAYQVGALEAISEYFRPEEIKYISSASVGALNSFAFASGELDRARKMWISLNEESEKLFITSVLRGGYLPRAVRMLSDKKIMCEKLYVPLFEIRKMVNHYVDISEYRGNLLYESLNASVAVFPICKPVLLGNGHYYDGALIDNIPVFPLMKHKLDYIICIYFDEYNYLFESRYFDNKVIKITFNNDSDIISDSVWFSKSNTEYMFENGYKRAKSILDFVFSSGINDAERVYSRIELMNSFNKDTKIRITGDVVINGLNKIARRVTRRNIVD